MVGPEAVFNAILCLRVPHNYWVPFLIPFSVKNPFISSSVPVENGAKKSYSLFKDKEFQMSLTHETDENMLNYAHTNRNAN